MKRVAMGLFELKLSQNGSGPYREPYYFVEALPRTSLSCLGPISYHLMLFGSYRVPRYLGGALPRTTLFSESSTACRVILR